MQRALEIIARPGFIHWNVFLNQQRGVVRRHRRSIHQSSSLEHRRCCQRGCQQHVALFLRHQKCRSHCNIHQHDLKRNSVNSRPGRDPAERDVVHLSRTQQVPREAGDSGSRQLYRDPEKWCGQQRAAVVAARSNRQAQQQTEQTVIEPEIKTEEEQSQQGQRLVQAAVLVHRVVNPVARARIPQDSRSVCQQKRLAGLRSLKIDGAVDLQDSGWPRAQQGDDQRSECYPRENVQPGKRKDEHLQQR